MRKTLAVAAVALLAQACRSRTAPEVFPALAEDFVYSSLGLSPVAATAAGYHRHRGVPLDELLDDYSRAALDNQRTFYREFGRRLDAIGRENLGEQERADYEIIRRQIQLSLLELDTIQSYRHNPTLYVELAGNALFAPFTLEYAPKPQRYRHIVARLRKVPALMQQARANLADAPEVWNRVAAEENEGNIALIDKTLREAAPAELRPDYDAAAEEALSALRSFNEFLARYLAGKTSDWRLGRERYSERFRLLLATDRTPEQLLADAEAELTSVRKRMFEIALPLHHRFYPSHRDPVDLNLIVGETLKRIAERHATPQTYVAEARANLEEARKFVREKNLLPLPARDNLQVIETPEFMRGIYAVGGFNPAPALEPELGAFYWITPIPPGWPKERVESKLREYNYYGLKLLTIHEAIPGHYVQLEYAHDLRPEWRRLLRGLMGSGAYVEGWAMYSTEMLLDEGFLGGSPELRLTFLKQQLRMLANTVLDVRLQTKGMTDEEALELMMNRAFQEKEEATAKLQRAKLTSVQLCTYFAGWRDWWRLRRHYQKGKGADFNLFQFHEQALKQGAVPLPALARLLTGTAP